MIPRTFPYWFESADDDQDLEILQVLVCSTPVEGVRRPAIKRVALEGPKRAKRASAD